MARFASSTGKHLVYPISSARQLPETAFLRSFDAFLIYFSFDAFLLSADYLIEFRLMGEELHLSQGL